MLSLKRIIGEAIIIDGDVKITVMDTQGEQIRFGIDAPKEIKVYCEEIYKRMQVEAGNDAAKIA